MPKFRYKINELEQKMDKNKENIGLALGRIPSGIFIVTFHNHKLNESDGMLMSWIQQCSFEPPMINIGVKKERKGLDLIQEAGHFIVNIMGKNNAALISKFFKGGLGAAKFTDMKTHTSEKSKALVLEDAIAYLECKLIATTELAGDHNLFIGQIIEGNLLSASAGEPSVHLRKSGYDY